MRWCADCGRPKEEHRTETVQTPLGKQRVRVCPVERRRGPSLPAKPDRYGVPIERAEP